MTKINLSHKVDYTKEDIVLVTRNGVMHDKTGGTRPLSEHYIKIQQQAGAGFVDYEFHENFISVNCYEVRPWCAVYRVRDFTDSEIDIIKSEFQFRLYKNKKYVFIRESDNGFEIYPEPYVGYIPVETEEEIPEKAFTLTECRCRKIKNTIKKWYWDISDRYIKYTTALTTASFSAKTMREMEGFLEFNKPENKGLLELYKSRHGANIENLSCVLDYMRLNEAMVKRHNIIQSEGEAHYEIFREAANKLHQEGSSTSILMWKRLNDEIVVYSHGPWPDEYIYIYNTKSKKQKILKRRDGAFNRLMYTHDNITRIYQYKDKVILLSSVKELFKDTNIEYIINNDIKEIGIIKRDHYEDYKFLSVVDIIKDDEIDTKAAMSLLSLSNNKVAELLLKAKLYNIFMVLLDSHNNIIAIQNKNSYADIEYLPKNTLQDSFNMNMSQIRILNERLTLQWDMENCPRYNAKTHEWDRVPLIRCSYKSCGVRLCRKIVGDNLRSIDNDLFKKMLDLSNTPNVEYDYRLIEEIRLATPAYTINQRLKMIEESKMYSSSYTYRDYLSMRRQLKEAMERHETVFEDRKYPIQPGEAIRYMAFRPGITQIGYRHPSTVEEFYNNLNDVYSSDQYEKVENGGEYGAVIHMAPHQNLVYLHDEIRVLLSTYTNAHKNEEFVAAVKRVKPLEYTDDEIGLQIVSPKSVEDLINEGRVLGHCVGSYVNAVIENKSNIMFIRRSDMPDFPYYTVEIVDNKIRQIHCYGNGDPTAEGQEYAYKVSKCSVYNKKFNIIQFITNWAKKKNKIDISSIKEHYGALRHM